MNTYLIQIIQGLASGGVLFLVASGLTLIFGAMRIVNFAHGSLYMLGSFLFLAIGNHVGYSNGTVWISMLLAALAVGLIGAVIEIVVIRPIYRKPPLTQLIVTFSLVLVIDGIVRGIWGTGFYTTPTPPALSGSVSILGQPFSNYQFALLALAAAVALVLWMLLYHTGLGRTIRAAVSDRELLAWSGRNVRWLFTLVFALAAFFAGLAGAAIAPSVAIKLGNDINVIAEVFAVVVIGGLGSLTGAFIASMIVGVVNSVAILWIPQVSLASVYIVLVVVLVVRPQGLLRGAGA